MQLTVYWQIFYRSCDFEIPTKKKKMFTYINHWEIKLVIILAQRK